MAINFAEKQKLINIPGFRTNPQINFDKTPDFNQYTNKKLKLISTNKNNNSLSTKQINNQGTA